MKWPKPMVLKCKTGLGAPAMGSGLFGFGPVGYLITLLAGTGVQYIVKQPSDIERLIASAVSEGAAGAVDKCIQACEGVSQPEPKCVSAEFRFSSHLSLGISITCLLISVAGWIWILWGRHSKCQSVKVEQAKPLEDSPSSADHLRHIARLQLAEVRSRSRKYGTP